MLQVPSYRCIMSILPLFGAVQIAHLLFVVYFIVYIVIFFLVTVQILVLFIFSCGEWLKVQTKLNIYFILKIVQNMNPILRTTINWNKIPHIYPFILMGHNALNLLAKNVYAKLTIKKTIIKNQYVYKQRYAW